MTEGTYTRKPFISFDRIDDKGVRAEVFVYTGFAFIDSIQETDSHKASQVKFKAEGAKYTVNGFVKNDTPVLEECIKAYETGEPLEFRIEKVRKSDKDRTIPMSQLSPPNDSTAARENTFRNLVAVRHSDSEWIIGDNISTRLEEDPIQTRAGGAYEGSFEEFTGKTSNSHNSMTQSYTPHVQSFESSSFYDKNPDGEINPGSSTVATFINTLSFVRKYNHNNDNLLSEEETQEVALTIIRVANELQKRIYNGKIPKPCLNFGSHTRARAIVFDLIDNLYPITPNIIRDKQEMKSWANKLLKEGYDTWEWAITHAEKFI